MAERREVVEIVLKSSLKLSVSKVCKYAQFSRTQYYYSKKFTHSKSQGRPCPGFTINRDGNEIKDTTIVDLLKKYRTDVHFMSSGGAKILSRYLAIEHGYYINHKKIYRLCRENNLLLYSALSVKKKVKKQRCEYRDITQPPINSGSLI